MKTRILLPVLIAMAFVSPTIFAQSSPQNLNPTNGHITGQPLQAIGQHYHSGGQPLIQTFTSGDLARKSQPLYVESPLDASFKIQQMLGDRGSLELETQTVDIGLAVACYADLKKVTPKESLLEALEYLGGMKSLKNNADRSNPRFKQLGGNRFEVTATPEYFKSLPARIKSFELGKQTVVIEVEYMYLDDTIKFESRKFMIEDSIKQLSGGIPQVVQQMPEKIQDSPYEVASSLRTSKSLPVTIGQMNQDGYERFKKLVKSRSNCGIIVAPTLVSLPGLDGIFQNGSVQNFVVGVEQKVSTQGTMTQPIMQQLERGRFFRANATPIDDKIRLECSIAFAKVMDGGSLNLKSPTAASGLSVQTPIHQVRQIDLNATISGENALVVDPYHSETKEITNGGKKTKQKHNIVAIIRAKVIAAEK
ncbi:MAG: hypothetical protein AB8B55_02980 [Mariniblastus sp.]